jgi:hypothetical protein
MLSKRSSRNHAAVPYHGTRRLLQQSEALLWLLEARNFGTEDKQMAAQYPATLSQPQQSELQAHLLDTKAPNMSRSIQKLERPKRRRRLISLMKVEMARSQNITLQMRRLSSQRRAAASPSWKGLWASQVWVLRPKHLAHPETEDEVVEAVMMTMMIEEIDLEVETRNPKELRSFNKQLKLLYSLEPPKPLEYATSLEDGEETKESVYLQQLSVLVESMQLQTVTQTNTASVTFLRL